MTILQPSPSNFEYVRRVSARGYLENFLTRCVRTRAKSPVARSSWITARAYCDECRILAMGATWMPTELSSHAFIVGKSDNVTCVGACSKVWPEPSTMRSHAVPAATPSVFLGLRSTLILGSGWSLGSPSRHAATNSSLEPNWLRSRAFFVNSDAALTAKV